MTDGIRISTNNFTYAEWHLRLRALIIDMLLVNVAVLLLVPGSMKLIYLLTGGLWSDLSTFFVGEGMGFLIAPLIYLTFFWGFFSRTVGMMVMKTKVADKDGKNISWIVAILRVFAYVLAGLLLFLGFLPIIFDKKRQGLHDKLTKTFVIVKR
jgi:uncharacterized RDD family membrane protein YckC